MQIADNEWDFVHQDISDKDIELFGLDSKATRFDDSWTMADIMVATDIMPSKNQARKQGFNQPLEFGFTEHVKTKRKKHITILNIGEWTNG